MIDDKVFVYSMGRSGGTFLSLVLKTCINKRELLNEPFDPTKLVINRSKYQKEITEFLENQEFTVMKQMMTNFKYYGGSKWFQADKYLFNLFGKVILNDRSNLLKRVVSWELVKKTGVYQADKENIQSYFHGDFEKFTLDINALEIKLNKLKREWRRRVDYLEKSDIPHVTVNYENFYSQIDLDSRIAQCRNICTNFLDQPFSYEHIGELLKHLSSKNKLNSKKTYSIIENIDEINDTLGMKYGFLY